MNLTQEQVLQLYSLNLAALAAMRHDARQPLTAVHANLETLKLLLEGGSRDAAHDMSAIIDDIVHDVKRLGQRLDQLRKLDPGDMTRGLATVSPSLVCAEIFARWTEKRFGCDPESPAELAWPLPKVLLHVIVSELVLNATRHAGADVQVLIAWRDAIDRVHFEVHDSGPGLAGLGRGFWPFDLLPDGQAAEARMSGLYLAWKALDYAGGSMLFGRSTQLGGALIQFSLPTVGSG